MGDILLTTPVIRALKLKFPSSQIDFVVKEQYKDALQYNPLISRLFIYEKEKSRELRDKLQEQNYDLAIDLQNNFRSRALTERLNIKVYRFHKPTMKKLLLVWFKINFLKDLKTISQRYAETSNVQLDEKGLDLLIPQDISSSLNEVKKYIGFCPGSKHFTKRWPAEYIIELGNELIKLGFAVVLLGGKSDKELCKTISEKIVPSINLQNDDNLLQTAVDMKNCKFIITNDSGLMHLASAVGVPIISIFGSTVREFGFAPLGKQNLILENKSLSCRPCSHIGKSSCPKKHFKCMKEITPQLVLTNLQKFSKVL